jgi:hypothetical protein
LLAFAAMHALVRMALIAAAGCSSSGNTTGVSGQLPGGAFELGDVISASVTTSDGAGGSTSDAQIVLASTPHLCSDAGATPPIDRKLQRFVTIQLRDVAGDVMTAPTAPGTYTIYPDSGSEPPKAASLLAGGYDGSCQPIDGDAAAGQSGTVTLTSVSGGHITGTFDPEPCTELAAALASTDQHSCM